MNALLGTNQTSSPSFFFTESARLQDTLLFFHFFARIYQFPMHWSLERYKSIDLWNLYINKVIRKLKRNYRMKEQLDLLIM